jgi:MFS family permease
MKKWVTLAFLSLAFFFYMTDRQLFGLLVIPIQQETGLNDIQLGFVDMAMYWVLACAMPFSGLLGDRFPRGRIIAVSIILWGVLAALTGLAGGLAGFLLFRSVGMTAAQTLYAPSAYALMASEHKTTRTIAFSTHQGAMYVGMLSSGLLVGVILSAFGSWRNVYFIFGGVTAAVGVAFALIGWGIVRGLFQANSITSVFDVVPPESRSSAVGFLNLFAYLIGSLAPLVIGVLSHRYGVAGFEIGFASMGGVLVVAAAVMLFSYLFLFEKKRVER